MANTQNFLPVEMYVQYQNAPNFKKLLRQLTDYITIPIDQFFTAYFDLTTCTTQGLDNWGKILNRTRQVNYYNYSKVFGFDNGVTPIPPDTGYPQNFQHGNFFSLTGSGLSLPDYAYRSLLQITYYSYIIDCTLGACASIITFYAKQQNPSYKCIITEGDMTFNYHFNYELQGWEVVLFTYSKILPAPAGINYTVTWVID